MEKYNLKIRKRTVKIKRRLLETENLQKAVRVEKIIAWEELEDSESKMSSRGQNCWEWWSLGKEIAESFLCDVNVNRKNILAFSFYHLYLSDSLNK